MGVIIRKRSGLFLMVAMAFELQNSSADGRGKGLSVIVQAAVGLKGKQLSSSAHTECCKYLGRMESFSGLSTILAFMSSFSALIADMLPSAIFLRLATLSVIPIVTRFFLFPILFSLPFFDSIFFRCS